LCDISNQNLCLDAKKVLSKINKRTKAIIYVTLNGRSGDLDKIQKVCNKRKLYLIEDAAHSIGSYSKKRHHGTFGIASSFSLSMPKLITTGQGGFVVTNNLKIFKKIKELKNFGRKTDGNDIYFSTGYNFKFTDLQSSLGLSQLSNISYRVRQKKLIFKNYYNELKNIKEIKMFKFNNSETPWFVDIYLKNPDKLKNYLRKFNIITRNVYPPLNTLKIFNLKGSFETSEYYCRRGLWLPSSVNLSKKDMKFITNKIKDFIGNHA
jgi:perosamine synthetase